MAVKRTRRTERRSSARADARLSMRVEGPHDEGARAQIVTESQNISSSGVYCLSDHYLAPLSKVALTIVLPKLPGRRAAEELIKCEGIVVRCDGPRTRSDKHYELACMFSDLDAPRRERIEAFVTWRNLQSLRAAAGGAAAPRAAARRRAVASSAARAARPAARAAARRAPRKSARRRTVH
uniref:PilZ domain-containing protein n=1 Tax=Eiseniibacteriota bacterium TaxID=2212470 RepID=A0A832I0D6_UNCEI